MKRIRLIAALAAVIPCFANAEYESSYKQTTAQEYYGVAKKQGSGIVSELSTHSKAALASKMSHMNEYEKQKYTAKINQYYGTNYNVDDLQNTGSQYANNIRLEVENNSRATVVEHAAEIETMKQNSQMAFGTSHTAPQGVDQATYERMVQTQQVARQSSQMGVDFAKEVTGQKSATNTMQILNNK